MWFKNLRIYRLTESFPLTAEELNQKLEEHPARDCGVLETYSYGWDRPLGRKGELLVHTAGHSILLCARRTDKVLPNSVVNEMVEERVAEIEEGEGRTVRRKERMEIKDAVTVELLPRAFVQSRRTYAYLDTQGGWLLIDATSDKKADELVEKLRESIGSLPLRPLSSAKAPAHVMTNWLLGEEALGDFVLLNECELRDTSDEGGVVRCRNQDLTSEEVRNHLEAGKQAVRLGLAWNERLEFLLSEDLSVRRLRFGEPIQEQAAEVESDDELARFDADFTLMSLELGQFIPALIEAFGGLESSE